MIRVDAETIRNRLAMLTCAPLDDEDEEEYLCGFCNGSGEGSYDGSICAWCHGSGVEPKDD